MVQFQGGSFDPGEVGDESIALQQSFTQQNRGWQRTAAMLKQNQDTQIVNKYIENNKIDLISNSLNEDLKKLVDFDLPFQIMYLEATYGHLQWLLNKWDKASMNSSVEIRSPFMDWEFFQYCQPLFF